MLIRAQIVASPASGQGHAIDPPAIYAWALRYPDEWDVDGARVLRKVAEGGVVNMAFKLTTNDVLVDMSSYARWSERASHLADGGA